jgi:hypothetical protein
VVVGHACQLLGAYTRRKCGALPGHYKWGSVGVLRFFGVKYVDHSSDVPKSPNLTCCPLDGCSTV